uniref:ATP synthase CF1 delta subunit n=1 Tax=Rhodella violacea TaxID=2801 RepID=UPI001FCCFF0E|nr:ATP synthase CF1 delta subunit [Rhodella violacea]UNJ18139.1 ATP synthase CF1 delta subunit [Rhodella violacea]
MKFCLCLVCCRDFFNIMLKQSITVSNKSLGLFFDNPIIANQDKKNLISKVFAEHVSSTVLDFLMVLVDRGRIKLLRNVAEKYLELAYKLSSITVAKVQTVQSFSPDQEVALIAKIKAMTQSDEVKLIVEIDEGLLGGFTVQVDSKIIDASLKGKIRQVASHLDVII